MEKYTSPTHNRQKNSKNSLTPIFLYEQLLEKDQQKRTSTLKYFRRYQNTIIKKGEERKEGKVFLRVLQANLTFFGDFRRKRTCYKALLKG